MKTKTQHPLAQAQEPGPARVGAPAPGSNPPRAAGKQPLVPGVPAQAAPRPAGLLQIDFTNTHGPCRPARLSCPLSIPGHALEGPSLQHGTDLCLQTKTPESKNRVTYFPIYLSCEGSLLKNCL